METLEKTQKFTPEQIEQATYNNLRAMAKEAQINLGRGVTAQEYRMALLAISSCEMPNDKTATLFTIGQEVQVKDVKLKATIVGFTSFGGVEVLYAGNEVKHTVDLADVSLKTLTGVKSGDHKDHNEKAIKNVVSDKPQKVITGTALSDLLVGDKYKFKSSSKVYEIIEQSEDKSKIKVSSESGSWWESKLNREIIKIEE